MEKNYKSSDKRLVSFFESSRDKWKERSMEVQQEKRRLLVENRDLRQSRDKWKERYNQLKEEMNTLKTKEKKTK